MRIFIVTDLEGVAGVDTFYVQTSPDGPGYARSCRLLTAEVNAAVAGFLAGGASDVIVWDGHGPGAVVFEIYDTLKDPQEKKNLAGTPGFGEEMQKKFRA